MFVCKAASQNPNGTILPKEQFDITVVSDGVYKLDRTTGEIRTLFDPYLGSDGSPFGDIKEKDATAERDSEEFFNQEEGGIKISAGDRSSFQVQSIGVGENSDIFVKVDSDWYQVLGSDNTLIRPTNLSGLSDDQTRSADGLFCIEWSLSGTYVLTDGIAGGLPLEQGANYPVLSNE